MGGLLWIIGAYMILVSLPVFRAAALHCFNTYDLGIYGEALWKLSWQNLNPFLNGRQIKVFNDHFDPIIFLAAPLAKILPPHFAAILFESLIMIGLVLPLWWLYKRQFLTKTGVYLCLLVLYFNFGTLTGLRFPVHPTVWAVLPIVLLGAALLLNVPYMVFMAFNLLCACKEEFPFIGVMLVIWLIGQKKWRLALGIGINTLLWLGGVFFLRPYLVGSVINYGPELLDGFREAPWGYFKERLFNVRMWGAIINLLIPLIPLFWWKLREYQKATDPLFKAEQQKRLKFSLSLGLLALPPLGIRFLALHGWRHQYPSTLVAFLVVLLLPWLQGVKIPKQILYSVALFLALSNTHQIRLALKMYGVPIKSRTLAHCPAYKPRLESIRAGYRFLQEHQGPDEAALVESNFYTDLLQRPHTYIFYRGPQRGAVPMPPLTYRYIFFEKPPYGGQEGGIDNTYIDKLTIYLRARARRLILDDPQVFLVEGEFTPDEMQALF